MFFKLIKFRALMKNLALERHDLTNFNLTPVITIHVINDYYCA